MKSKEYLFSENLLEISGFRNLKVKYYFGNISFFFVLLPSFFFLSSVNAQLKFIVEDFEGIADGASDLKANGIFSFGNITGSIIKEPQKETYSGERFIKLKVEGNKDFGGWGKGLGSNIELDVKKDYLNFYVYTNDTNTIKIELQEDDNGDHVYKKENDDSWFYFKKLDIKDSWQLISLPLNQFKDNSKSGDGIFNISYKEGKLFSLIITFTGHNNQRNYLAWSFDFFCFSQGKLPVRTVIFAPPSADAGDFCSLGAWSKEGNTADFSDIASGFEKNFNSEKKLGVVHFFQPFSIEKDREYHYPSVERINKIIVQGYIPMITIEDHFVKTNPGTKQPNLYSIIEGHFDSFFSDWASQIKKVDGLVLLRILHEFNGDWYPWCIVNNDKNPELLIKAFRHIHDIFKNQDAINVKFIWCPNSTSYPQEKWNFIMSAYPGDEYVDFVGLDIYNGAGKGLPPWRSFRKEGIENYFILTQRKPDKPLLICETASRERTGTELKSSQDKAEWIKQMSEALVSDMSKVRLLTWFNEKKTYPVNSSILSKETFQHYILYNNYFKSGTGELKQMLGKSKT